MFSDESLKNINDREKLIWQSLKKQFKTKLHADTPDYGGYILIRHKH